MSTEDRLDELERYYKQQLILLQESYNKAAEPIIKRLMEIDNCRPRRYVIPLELLNELFKK